MARLLLLWHNLGNGNQNLDGKETNAILVIGDQMLEEVDHLVNDDAGGHLLDEFGKVSGGLAPNHGSLVVHQEAELLAKLFLRARGDLLVGSCEETTARNLGREPVGLSESESQGDKIFFDLLRRKLLADLVQRLDGLVALSTLFLDHPRDCTVPCRVRLALRWLPGSPREREGHGPIGSLLRTQQSCRALRSEPPTPRLHLLPTL